MRLRLPALALLFALSPALHAAEARTISIVTDAQPGALAQHGLAKLEAALAAQGYATERVATANAAHGSALVAMGQVASELLREKNIAPPTEPESLVEKRVDLGGKPALLVAGADDRGLMYALLDVADRIGWTTPGSPDPFAAVRDVKESPLVRDRSLSVYTMNRAHWEGRFYDERYWARYFDMMAADRFNRFLIVFGYENGGFLAPPYPYFFNTPGFDGVHMVDLTREQQEKNLAALNRLIELAHARGIAVSLGIWDHIYRGGVQTGGAEWLADYKGRPVPNTVEGVTTENLSAYTLASLKELLARAPAVDGIQFRVHEESGLKREEMDDFWRVVFTAMQKIKPGLLLEARAKGTPDSVINTALALGVNLRVETKYWMEQQGLPFHPSHINRNDQQNRRHGYADLLRYPQRYQIDWRLWNGGTTRVLLWADPEYVRRYSKSTLLYDSPNWDVQEPLATKMEAQKPDMPDFALMPDKYRYYDYEFERYWHFFQVWGRVGYNPNTPADVWEHEFIRRFGASAAPHVEAGLHRASQVLPMIVAAVYPYSAFPTTRGWAERQSLGASLDSYAKNQGTDIEQFENFADAAQRILDGGATAKRTPDATSRWFDATADAILAEVRAAESAIGANRNNEFDATITDLKILAQLARFHARRAIAAVHYNLFKRGLKLPELLAATTENRAAVAAWRELVAAAGDRYNFDLAMGARRHDLCGHWRDELVKLEADQKDLEAQCCPPDETTAKAKTWQPANHPAALPVIVHDRIHNAAPGEPLTIIARVTSAAGIKSVRVRYRHVTQFEDYATLDLKSSGEPDVFSATIPGAAISAPWDFMYFIEAIDTAGHGTIWPNLEKEAPYVIVNVAR